MGAESNKDSEADMASRKKLISTLLIVAVLVLGFLGWVYWNRFQDIFELQDEIVRLKEREDELREQISSLEEKLARRNDLDYFETLAKEELGLVYPEAEEG